MSAVSSREKSMLLVMGVVVLYAAAALSFRRQVANWRAARRAYDLTDVKLREERALIAARDDWAERYEQMRGLLPIFPYERDVATHWLNLMDSVASRNGLTIARRQANREIEVGDVYELPISCLDWEGTLESLVKFLHDLQQEGAMLDVRQLFVRPSNRPGYLKGAFTLYCAYMRGDVPRGESPSAVAPAAVAPTMEEPAAPAEMPDAQPVGTEAEAPAGGEAPQI